jgi:hypothetical protein
VIEYLLCKHKVLSSNSSPIKEKNQNTTSEYKVHDTFYIGKGNAVSRNVAGGSCDAVESWERVTEEGLDLSSK